MEINRKCPQCGTQFQGRSNKRYCSDKCKLSAFKDAKTQAPQSQNLPTIVSMPTIPEHQLNLTPKNEPSIMLTNERNEAELLCLQIELRKMELAHEIRLAEMTATENDKQRNFELEKLRFHPEKEKQYQPPKTEEAKVIPNKIKHEDVPIETVNYIPLPKNLKEVYDDYVNTFLEREGELLNITEIAEFGEEILDLRRAIIRFIKSHNLEEEEVVEHTYIKKISNMLDDTADTITLKSLKAMAYHLDDDWREELVSSLG